MSVDTFENNKFKLWKAKSLVPNPVEEIKEPAYNEKHNFANTTCDIRKSDSQIIKSSNSSRSVPATASLDNLNSNRPVSNHGSIVNSSKIEPSFTSQR
jgi:hypothetical protein